MIETDLDQVSRQTLNICPEVVDEEETDTNLHLIDFVLKKSVYDRDGRLKMPLFWNNKCSHLFLEISI